MLSGIRGVRIVDGKDVRSTYKRPDCSYADQCAIYLSGNGWTPMGVSDHKFPALNVFANYSFYSGFARKNVFISEVPDTLEKINENIIKRIGLKAEIKTGGGSRGSDIHLYNEGKAYIARFLESMGIPRNCGPKSDLKTLKIPKYRRDLYEIVQDEGIPDSDREIVRRLERDATAVLLGTRLSPDLRYSKDIWQINSISRPTRKDAGNLMKENLKLIKFSVPECPISEKDIRTRKMKSGKYSAYFNINGKQIGCFLETSNRDLLKFNPGLQERYGFNEPFEPCDISDLL